MKEFAVEAQTNGSKPTAPVVPHVQQGAATAYFKLERLDVPKPTLGWIERYVVHEDGLGTHVRCQVLHGVRSLGRVHGMDPSVWTALHQSCLLRVTDDRCAVSQLLALLKTWQGAA